MDAIFSVFHGNSKFPTVQMIRPIKVGNANLTDISFDYFADNTLDNIAHLNPHFCELTAMYWIWKNYKQNPEEIIGLVHYRRYLIPHLLPFFIYDYMRSFFKKAVVMKKMGVQKIRQDELVSRLPSLFVIKLILNRFKIILPYPVKCDFPKYEKNIWDSYAKEHIEDDIILIKNIVKERYPECISSFCRLPRFSTS